MRTRHLVVAASLVMTLAACSDHDARDADPAVETGGTPETPTSYLGYVHKMIASTNDAEEPWNVDGIAVEQDDGKEATDVN